jgi:ribosomal protein L37AE/L43A
MTHKHLSPLTRHTYCPILTGTMDLHNFLELLLLLVHLDVEATPPNGVCHAKGTKMLSAKRFSLVILVLLAFTSVFAQSTKTKMPAGKTQTVYACTHCDMAAMKSGKCAMCKMDMSKVKATVMYHCDHCNKDMAMGGKCPTCKGMTTKMAMVYTCDHCKTTSAKMGKCTKCKMDMKKHSMKMKS